MEPPLEVPPPVIPPDEPEPIDPDELLFCWLRLRVDDGAWVCWRSLRFVVLVLLPLEPEVEPDDMPGVELELFEVLGDDDCAKAVPATSSAAAVMINVRMEFPLMGELANAYQRHHARNVPGAGHTRGESPKRTEQSTATGTPPDLTAAA